MKNYSEAIKAYKQADKIVKEHNYNVGDDICSLLRQAQREKFMQDENERTQRLQNIEKLIEKVKPFLLNQNVASLNQAGPSTEVGPSSGDAIENSESASSEGLQELKLLEEFLQQAKNNAVRPPPPDAIYGKISFELMHDPVITPSGVTYDRINILEHLARVGHFDPLTRQPLKAEYLVTNYALKELIDDFIEKNPWLEDDF